MSERKIPQWVIDECDSITINDKKRYFQVQYVHANKTINSNRPSIQLELCVWSEEKGDFLEWNEFKGSYLAEKLCDYIMNTINGQRRVYWSNNHERDFNFNNKEKVDKK